MGQNARGSQAQIESCAGLFKAFVGETPDGLAHAPIAASKGILAATAGRLASAFGMESISDMAGSDPLRQAQGIVTLADEEQPGPNQASPLT